MTTKEAILSADAANDMRFDMSASIVDFHIRSMICAPLVAGDGEALGVIQLDALDQRNRFRQDDLEMLVSVACQAAIAVENAQLHESAMRDQAIGARVGGRSRSAAWISADGCAADSRIRFLRVLRAGQPVGRRLLRLHRPARRPLGGRGGGRFGQGHFRLAADGQAFGGDALLPGERARSRPGHRAAQPRLLRQRVGRPVRDDGAGGARSASARGHDRQRRPSAAAVALLAQRGRAGGGGRVRPAARASIATSITPHARCRFRPAIRWFFTPTASPRR